MNVRIWIALFLSFGLSACGGPKFMDKTKIDGSILRGTAVSKKDPLFGRTVYIAKNFSFDSSQPSLFSKLGLCSGVIIHERYILTAAHCTTNIQESRVIFSEDVNKALTPYQIYKIQNSKVHESYTAYRNMELEEGLIAGPNNRSHRYDVAILKLDRPIEGAKFSKTYFKEIDTVLYMTKSLKKIAHGYVAGYGRISEYNNLEEDPRYQNNSTPLNGTLMKAKLILNSTDLSRQLIKRNQRFSTGVCVGDSGAPLFIERNGKNYLQALAIATFKVRDEDPENKYTQCFGESLFLNLDFHKQWIYNTMIELEGPTPPVMRRQAI